MMSNNSQTILFIIYSHLKNDSYNKKQKTIPVIFKKILIWFVQEPKMSFIWDSQRFRVNETTSLGIIQNIA